MDLKNIAGQNADFACEPLRGEILTYDFESMSNYSDGHELFAVVAAIHHQRVGKALDYGALCLAESLDSISAGGVRDVDWGAYLNIISVGSLS